jgi:hypothetical protein
MANNISVAVADSETIASGLSGMTTSPLATVTVAGKFWSGAAAVVAVVMAVVVVASLVVVVASPPQAASTNRRLTRRMRFLNKTSS